MRTPVTLVILVALLCGACCCAGGNTAIRTTTQPSALSPEAVGQIAAAVAAEVNVGLTGLSQQIQSGGDSNVNSGWLLAVMAVVPYISGKITWLLVLLALGQSWKVILAVIQKVKQRTKG